MGSAGRKPPRAERLPQSAGGSVPQGRRSEAPAPPLQAPLAIRPQASLSPQTPANSRNGCQFSDGVSRRLKFRMLIVSFITMEHSPMWTLNAIDPAGMSPEERCAEVASILARGVIRLRTRPNSAAAGREKPDLGFSGPERLHTNPASRVRKTVSESLLAKQRGV